MMASALTHHRRLAFPQTAREEPSVAGRPAAREPARNQRARIKARHQGTHLASPAPPRWVRLSAASHSHGQPGAGQLGRATDGEAHHRLHAPCSIHPRLVAGSEKRGRLPSQEPGPACVAVSSCRATDNKAALNRRRGANGRRERCVLSHTSLLGVGGVEPWAGVWSRASQSLHSRGGGGPCTARGLGNGERRLVGGGTSLPWLSLCALALLLQPGQGRYLTTWSMLQAAWCMVLSSALERASCELGALS